MPVQWDPRKLQDWHLRVIDMMIADPTLTAEQIALELDVTSNMVAILRRTDLFRLALEERRDQISAAVDSQTLGRITGRLSRLANKSLETLTEQVDKERLMDLASPSKGTTETCEMALKALGFIKQGGGGAPTQVNQTTVVRVDASIVDAARERMREVHARQLTGQPGQQALPAPLTARAGR